MFSTRKVAQVAAFFADSAGGLINVMKLIKLMYLADRESMRRYGEPISFDHMVSMNNGPVLSQTLDLINGDLNRKAAAEWDEWITDREDHNVGLHRHFSRQDLDMISGADAEVLEAIWAQFGKLDQWGLSDYTHKNCPEWKYPNGSCLPIKETDLLVAVGKDKDEAAALARNIQAARELDRVFARL